MIDSEALDGVRGWLAVYVAVYHMTYLHRQIPELNGSAAMPAFFLMSGFVLALGDGRTQWAKVTFGTELKAPIVGEQPPRYNARHFLWRRLVRIAPVYYLCNLVDIPLMYLGYAWPGPPRNYWMVMLFTLTGTSTWMGADWWSGQFNFSIDEVSWFVCTLWFFYLLYPTCLPRLQQLSSKQKVTLIYRLFWLQLIVVPVVHWSVCLLVGYWQGLSVATFWPPVRMPVFIMGVLAGLLRLTDTNAYTAHGFAMLCWLVKTPGESEELTTRRQQVPRQQDPEWWARTVDVELAVSATLFVLDLVFISVYPEFDGMWPCAVYVQIILPFSQLTILYGLTCDGRQSRLSHLLCASLSQWLGKISYALYLSHTVVIECMALAWHGPDEQPVGCGTMMKPLRSTECDDKWDKYTAARNAPLWTVLLIAPSCVLVAAAIHYAFEEPLRVRLGALYTGKPRTYTIETPENAEALKGGYGTFAHVQPPTAAALEHHIEAPPKSDEPVDPLDVVASRFLSWSVFRG